ncbi:MAG: RimK family alpha-L-glutamate ligase [Planctomycetaceae bacterium]
MRVAVLGERGGWHVERLDAALRRRGHAVDVISWRSVAAAVATAGPRIEPPPLAKADVVAVRGMPGLGEESSRLEEVIFRMDAVAQLAAGGTPVVNPPRALEIAIDKYLSLAILARAGIAVPRTIVVQSAASARRAWEELGGDCVAKPLFGSRGRGVVRLTDADAAGASVSTGLAYVQEFVPHAGWDFRVLVVGDEAFAMRRVAEPGEWRTNVSLGGRPAPAVPPAEVIAMARRAAAAVGARIAGVDVLPAADGPVVLEVNAVPAWRGLQTVTAADVTEAVAGELERAGTAGGNACPD